MKALHCFPGKHSISVLQEKKTMLFQKVELNEGKNPIISQAEFIRAVADNMKQRLFTTASNRAQPNVRATRKENSKTVVSQRIC